MKIFIILTALFGFLYINAFADYGVDSENSFFAENYDDSMSFGYSAEDFSQPSEMIFDNSYGQFGSPSEKIFNLYEGFGRSSESFSDLSDSFSQPSEDFASPSEDFSKFSETLDKAK